MAVAAIYPMWTVARLPISSTLQSRGDRVICHRGAREHHQSVSDGRWSGHRGARRLASDRSRGLRRHLGTVGLRKIDAAAHPRMCRYAVERRAALRRPRCRLAARCRSQRHAAGEDWVRLSAILSASHAHRLGEHRASAGRSSDRPRRPACAHRRASGVRRPRASRASSSFAALRRRNAAGRHCPRARQPARASAGRRADRRARSRDRRTDRRALRSRPAGRHGHRHRHARPGDGVARRPNARDARRPDRAGGIAG